MAKAPKDKESATGNVPASTVEDTKPKAWSYDIPADTPFVIGMTQIARLTVETITYREFIKVLAAANGAAMREKSEKVGKYFARERMKAQLRAWAADGKQVAIDDGSLMMMPIQVAAKARAAVSEASGADPGSILNDADGISAPIRYRLGQPLRMSAGKAGEASDAMMIEEIEIQARTLGDIEDVLATDGQHEQAMALLSTLAKPVGGPVQLQALPSWAVDQIGLADGLFVSQEILKRFL